MGISLYVHIPFCEHRCGYCSFVSMVGEAKTKDRYLELLSKEMELLSLSIPSQSDKIPVDTLYFGGGTPSCLNNDQIKRLFDSLARFFSWFDHSEITWEANPNTVSAEQAVLLRSLGVNRVSMGLQVANDEILQTIDRIHRVKDYYRAYDIWVSAGFSNLSADLMTGLPGLRKSDLDRALDRLLRLPAIRHLSTYALTLEEDAPMKKRHLLLPSDDEERDQFEHLRQRVVASGMQRYEISNFAYPGWESRHNSNYWTGNDYYALGLGASSKVGSSRYQNPDRLPDYEQAIESGLLPRMIVERLSEADRRFEQIILPLRTAKGLMIDCWEAEFKRCFDRDYPGVLERLLENGLATYRDRCLRLTDRGFDLSNQIFTLFMNEV